MGTSLGVKHAERLDMGAAVWMWRYCGHIIYGSMGERVVNRDVCAVAQLVGALDPLSLYAYVMALVVCLRGRFFCRAHPNPVTHLGCGRRSMISLFQLCPTRVFDMGSTVLSQ